MSAPGTILIASGSTASATAAKKALQDLFESIHLSTQAEQAAADFDHHCPRVLVFAFDSLELAGRHNLGLYRQSKEIHRQLHRTILLCSSAEADRAFELCRDKIFDDYAIFWPQPEDALRLPMAVHQALRGGDGERADGRQAAEFAARAHRLGELETVLEEKLKLGDEPIDAALRAIRKAVEGVDQVGTGFRRRIGDAEVTPNPDGRDTRALGQAFDRLRQDSLKASLQTAATLLEQLKGWLGEFRRASQPSLDLIRSLQTLAVPVEPLVMVVDDDPFQFKIIERLLKGEGLRLVSATSGIEALNLLYRVRPALILMDFSMPEMDGLEVIRWIKGVARFASIPIIMITGDSEERVVTESLTAGADDFMVKPLAQDLLIAKVASFLR